MQVLPDEIVENMNREKKITLDKESQTLSLGI